MGLRTLNKSTLAMIIFNYMVTMFGLTNWENKSLAVETFFFLKKSFKLEDKKNNATMLNSYIESANKLR